MADFLGDAVSTDILPRKTKKTKTKTKYVTRRPLSKQAIIAIAIVVAVVLIAALILFIIMYRRRKARAKHMSTLPGYSTDSSNGLYSATPGYAAGNRYGAQQVPGGSGGQEMQTAGGGFGNFGENNSSGQHGGDGQGGAAADYYGSYGAMQGGGAGQGQDYGRGGYGMPQRPPMTFDPSPAPR